MARIPLMAKVAAAVFAFDQLTKLLVVFGLDLKTQGVIDVIPRFATFRMAWNRGINFGLFENGTDLGRWLLIGIAVVISGWVGWWIVRDRPGWKAEAAAGALIGGAMGNALDRVLYGAVADFLNVTCCGIRNPYAFNVADIAIFAGAIGLILFTGRAEKAAAAPVAAPVRGKAGGAKPAKKSTGVKAPKVAGEKPVRVKAPVVPKADKPGDGGGKNG